MLSFEDINSGSSIGELFKYNNNSYYKIINNIYDLSSEGVTFNG